MESLHIGTSHAPAKLCRILPEFNVGKLPPSVSRYVPLSFTRLRPSPDLSLIATVQSSCRCVTIDEHRRSFGDKDIKQLAVIAECEMREV